MPNFLIIGAARSGTTALYYFLKQHPEIYMSPSKEPSFFMLEGAPNLEETQLGFTFPSDRAWIKDVIRKSSPNRRIFDVQTYSSLFTGVTDEKAVGEATPGYLYVPGVPERILKYIPKAKMIAILRQPVDRAYSHFSKHARNENHSLNSFFEALKKEQVSVSMKMGGQLHYLRTGLYYAQLKRYYDVFPRDQIKVYLYDHMDDDPSTILQDIYRFLGVDIRFSPDLSVRFNASGSISNKLVGSLLGGSELLKSAVKKFAPATLVNELAKFQNRLQNSNLTRQTLSNETRRELTELYYREDILMLQELIDLDLSRWLK